MNENNEICRVQSDLLTVHSGIYDKRIEYIYQEHTDHHGNIYGRRDNLRFGGMPEQNDENCDIRMHLLDTLHITTLIYLGRIKVGALYI